MESDLRAWRRSARALVSVAAALATILSSAAPRAAAPPAARGAHAMVVTPEPHATRVGVEVLRAGGNAVDAAVAVACTLAVTYPRAGNLAGGGFLLYRTPDGVTRALDFRESAPAALTSASFLDERGTVVRERALRGGLAVAVPGSVAGLFEVHRRFGKRSWRSLLRPAIDLAAHGFPLSHRGAASIAEHVDRLAVDPEARRIFTDDGRPLAEGTRLVQRDLARTLRTVARHGPDGMRRGAVADAIVAAVQRSGGVLTAEDLAGYRPVWREPLAGTYRGYRVLSFPPPSSGGLVLLASLTMLERFDVAGAGFGSSLSIHRLAEVARRAYADRARWMGDPDFVEVPTSEILDRARLEERAAAIDDDRATPSSDVMPWSATVAESPDTLHVSIVDPAGGAVSLTTTLNSAFGAAIVPPGTGVLLNNEIDDFALAPDVPNQFGLVGSDANAVAPGKRPLSSMTPTIVEGPDGEIALVLGSPGGSRIINSVVQVLVNVVDHGMELQEAVNAARVHHQWVPDTLFVERPALSADVRDALVRRGHTIEILDPIGMVEAIGRAGGVWLGAADPRGPGTAEGW